MYLYMLNLKHLYTMLLSDVNKPICIIYWEQKLNVSIDSHFKFKLRNRILNKPFILEKKKISVWFWVHSNTVLSLEHVILEWNIHRTEYNIATIIILIVACYSIYKLKIYLLNSNLNFTWRYKFVSYGGRHHTRQALNRNKFVAPCTIQVWI